MAQRWGWSLADSLAGSVGSATMMDSLGEPSGRVVGMVVQRGSVGPKV
ncbi:MAG: hypothetical protein R3B67_13815 [Phycisphaerales bacterium]